MSLPKGIITANEAKELSDNWSNLREKANQTAAEKPDNRSSWYSIEDLENFIKHIKAQNNDVSGIRFYLGVEITKDPKGYTTIFMAPTKVKGSKNIDILNADCMDRGIEGSPPAANYPQQ